MTYEKFIKQIIDERGQWNEEVRNDCCERHHILPKCKGGLPKNLTWRHHENVIWLTPKEHFIAHRLLALENQNDHQLVLAWSKMAFPKGKTNREFELTPEEYDEIRRVQSQALLGENNPQYGRTPWNKGLTKFTDERIREYGEKNKGKNTWCRGVKKTEEQKKKMSQAQKKRAIEHPESFQPHIKGMVCIYDGKISKYINKDEELPEGFQYGQCKHKSYNIKDREKYSKICSDRTSGDKNPMYGKGYKLSGGKNGHATLTYFYKGKEYECRKYLLTDLKLEYPEISENTIRSIVYGEYKIRTANKYKDLIENLSWRYKDENKENIEDNT